MEQIAEIRFCSLFDPNKHSLSATSPFSPHNKNIRSNFEPAVISVETVLAEKEIRAKISDILLLACDVRNQRAKSFSYAISD